MEPVTIADELERLAAEQRENCARVVNAAQELDALKESHEVPQHHHTDE